VVLKGVLKFVVVDLTAWRINDIYDLTSEWGLTPKHRPQTLTSATGWNFVRVVRLKYHENGCICVLEGR